MFVFKKKKIIIACGVEGDNRQHASMSTRHMVRARSPWKPPPSAFFLYEKKYIICVSMKANGLIIIDQNFIG